MKRPLKVLTIIWLVITVIGVVSFVGKMRGVNAGAFIFPGLVTLRLLILQKKS